MPACVSQRGVAQSRTHKHTQSEREDKTIEKNVLVKFSPGGNLLCWKMRVKVRFGRRGKEGGRRGKKRKPEAKRNESLKVRDAHP